MKEEERIRIIDGALPDGKEFVANERLAEEVIALGSLEAFGKCDESGLAGDILRIGRTDGQQKVCGVKIEDRTALVVVYDPGDWNEVETSVVAAIEAFLDGTAEEVPTDDGIRIVPDEHDQAVRHFICPNAMHFSNQIASAGMLHVPTQHGTSALADEINRISFVRGVLIEGNAVRVAIKDADRWDAAEHYVVEELKRVLDGRFQAEAARRTLCPSCRNEERTGPVGTASMRCTCEPEPAGPRNIRSVAAHPSAEEIRIQMLADEQASEEGRDACLYSVLLDPEARELLERYCKTAGLEPPDSSRFIVTPQLLLALFRSEYD